MTFEDHTDRALGRGWDAVRGLVVRLTAALTLSPMLRAAARREAVVLLRQAEALVRRAVLILALRLPEPKPRRGHPASADTLARLRALPKADVPAFALTEPHPGATGFWEEVSLEALAASHTPAHLPHSVGTIGADGRGCGTLSLEDSDQFVEPGALIPRLAALQAALDAPEKQAKRMARWLTRQRRARETGPARLNPMRLGHPPTVTKARRHRFPKSTQALIDLHHFAQRVFDSS